MAKIVKVTIVIPDKKNGCLIGVHVWTKRRMKMEEEIANNMDLKAINIVKMYIREHFDKSDMMPDFEVYTVWKCKTLQNWKYLLASTLFDGMYYELTFNGDKNEWYLDAYKKFENRCIKEAGER